MATSMKRTLSIGYDAAIEQLIDARNAARKARNFQESDRLRDELLARGIVIEDTAGGTRWRRKA